MAQLPVALAQKGGAEVDRERGGGSGPVVRPRTEVDGFGWDVFHVALYHRTRCGGQLQPPGGIQRNVLVEHGPRGETVQLEEFGTAGHFHHHGTTAPNAVTVQTHRYPQHTKDGLPVRRHTVITVTKARQLVQRQVP